MPQQDHDLPRVLTAKHAAAIVVGIIIGSGIFLVPREMMAAVGSSALVYAVWIAGGLLSLFGAMSYAELAAMKPRVGGEYAFLHDAYGPTTAFLYTWTWTTIAKPASIATIAAGLMRVLGTFAAFSFLTHRALGPILWSQLAAILATWLITALNIVGTLYMLTNAAIQYVLPATSIANSARPAADAMRLVAGHAGSVLVSIGMAISIGATFVGSSLSGARVPFAAARDRLFPPALAAIHPRFHTPWKSLILQAVISSLLLLAVGKFQALFSLAIISEWLFYALTTSSVFIFRHREPETPRPYRVSGYPVVPALFIAAAALLLVFSFIDQPLNSIAGTLVILAGIPIHHLYQRRNP